MANLRRRSTKQLLSLLSNKKLECGTYEYRIDYGHVGVWDEKRACYLFYCSTRNREAILHALGEYTGWEFRNFNPNIF